MLQASFANPATFSSPSEGLLGLHFHFPLSGFLPKLYYCSFQLKCRAYGKREDLNGAERYSRSGCSQYSAEWRGWCCCNCSAKSFSGFEQQKVVFEAIEEQILPLKALGTAPASLRQEGEVCEGQHYHLAAERHHKDSSKVLSVNEP